MNKKVLLGSLAPLAILPLSVISCQNKDDEYGEKYIPIKKSERNSFWKKYVEQHFDLEPANFYKYNFYIKKDAHFAANDEEKLSEEYFKFMFNLRQMINEKATIKLQPIEIDEFGPIKDFIDENIHYIPRELRKEYIQLNTIKGLNYNDLFEFVDKLITDFEKKENHYFKPAEKRVCDIAKLFFEKSSSNDLPSRLDFDSKLLIEILWDRRKIDSKGKIVALITRMKSSQIFQQVLRKIKMDKVVNELKNDGSTTEEEIIKVITDIIDKEVAILYITDSLDFSKFVV